MHVIGSASQALSHVPARPIWNWPGRKIPELMTAAWGGRGGLLNLPVSWSLYCTYMGVTRDARRFRNAAFLCERTRRGGGASQQLCVNQQGRHEDAGKFCVKVLIINRMKRTHSQLAMSQSKTILEQNIDLKETHAPVPRYSSCKTWLDSASFLFFAFLSGDSRCYLWLFLVPSELSRQADWALKREGSPNGQHKNLPIYQQ